MTPVVGTAETVEATARRTNLAGREILLEEEGIGDDWVERGLAHHHGILDDPGTRRFVRVELKPDPADTWEPSLLGRVAADLPTQQCFVRQNH